VHSRLPPFLATLLLASLTAGCLGDGAKDDATTLPPALPATSPVAAYLHDLSQPIPGVSWTDPMTSQRVLLEHYLVSTTGEVKLDTWVYRPDIPDKVPVVLTITPYYGGGLPQSNPVLGTPASSLAVELVRRGYAVGWSSVRGTGDSGGCFTQGGPQEAKDSAAVIEYVAQQPWSNGNVGLIGVSYDGTTPQETWVEAPAALKAIVPIAGISDMYDYNFVNGVPINVQGFGFNTYYWGIVGLGPAGLEGGVGATDPASVPGAVQGEACEDQVEVQEGGASSTVDGNKDAYWQERDFLARLQADPGRPRAAVFYIHGLQDWNVKPHMMEGWLDAVQASGVPFKAWLGQWGHAWPQSSPGAECNLGEDGSGSACRHDWWNQTLVAWFDQFLKGRDTGILDAPAVQVQDDDGVWRHEDHWPPKDAAWHTFHPAPDGKLAAAPASGQASYFDNAGGFDQAAVPAGSPVGLPALNGATSAIFVSEPLTADWRVSGLPRFVGNVTATGHKASLVLTLAERLPDGTDRAFNFAALSLNHVDSLASGRPDIAGARQGVVLDFFPQDDVVHAGSRLVLIAAGNTANVADPGPGLQPVSDGSTITLDLDGARLVLPVDHSLVVEDPQPYDE
jgi:predicted acyl esterase